MKNVQIRQGDLCQISPDLTFGKVYAYHEITCQSGESGYILDEYFQYFEPADN
ncbi:hypothetical protein [Neisseria yangbaofengii]|uniref:hypothetical protein n=1 Tax=Neisseria yangbaofengii TaxID=2709396 RepID=UPI001868C847|nr:hypothetical protein [Neisseria yangbaofengii]